MRKRIFILQPLKHQAYFTPITRAVAADSGGYVYVGTNDGFYRFNGYEFDKYPVTGPESVSCPIHNIRCLHWRWWKHLDRWWKDSLN